MDLEGMSPTRRIEQTDNGYIVHVRPPDFMGCPEVSVFLTPDQYKRYVQWRDQDVMIQDALPDLSISEREMLISGLGDEDFHRIVREK
jgi:hypothetical protein